MIDMKSWLTGFILGLCGKPLPFTRKTPTAYSYNGVVLPELPELPTAEDAPEGYAYYNGVMFPDLSVLKYYSDYNYHSIFISSNGLTYAYFSNYPFYVCYNSPDIIVIASKTSDTDGYCRYSFDGSAWTDRDTSTGYLANYKFNSFIWADYDINWVDSGDLYFSASTPLTQEEAYLYAVIISASDGSYHLNFTQAMRQVTTDGELSATDEGVSFSLSEDSASWSDTTTCPAGMPIWANYDITSEDNTLYLSASDPVPVYE